MNNTGEIIQWIDLGMPDLKRIRQSLGKSHFVKIFSYQEDKAIEWFEKIKGSLIGNDKLSIYHFMITANGPVDKFIERSMKLSCIIEDGKIQFSNDNERIAIDVIKAL